MATLNSLRNIVGSYSSTAAAQTITFTIGAGPGFVKTATAGSRIYLSVGDTLVITGNVGASGYAIGDEIVVSSVDNASGIFIATAAGTPGAAVGVTATIKNRDTDPIVSIGGNTITSTFTDVVAREWNAITINGGATKTLITAAALGDATKCQVLFVLDSVTTTAGVAAPTATFQLQLTDGTDMAVLANLRAGDVFYSSQLSSTLYDPITPGAVVGNFALKNTTAATAFKPTFRLVIGTAA